MAYVAIAVGVFGLIGLVVLWGWYRHKLELEGLHIAGVVLRAQVRMAEEAEKKKSRSSDAEAMREGSLRRRRNVYEEY